MASDEPGRDLVPLPAVEAAVVVVPYTGELVALDDPERCALLIEEIRRLEAQLAELKRDLARPVAEESARQATRSFTLGNARIKVVKNNVLEWDMTELIKLLDAGLPEDRYRALVREEVTYKVSAREADRIAKANPDYRVIIERARTEVERDPRIEVERTK